MNAAPGRFRPAHPAGDHASIGPMRAAEHECESGRRPRKTVIGQRKARDVCLASDLDLAAVADRKASSIMFDVG
jgi:hypothetical protein